MLDDFVADWAKNGKRVLSALRRKRPADYVRTAIALLPMDIKIEHSAEMTDDEVIQRIRQLAAELGIVLGFPEGAPGAVGKLDTSEHQEPAQKLLPVR